MKKYLGRSVFVFVCIAALSCMKDDNTNNGNPTNATDTEFMRKAAEGNKAEVAAGSLASGKAMVDSVRLFATMMVNDHSSAQGRLDSIAENLKYTMPAGPDSMHLMQIQQLSSLEGHAFDSVYLAGQANDHQAAIDLYNREATNGANDALRKYATDVLPKLHMHYDMVIRLSHVR